MFLDCPAYFDDAGSVRCGLPAEVEYCYLVNSSDGPLENAKIRCPLGHWFNAPIEFLTWKKTPLMRSGVTARARRNGLPRRRAQVAARQRLTGAAAARRAAGSGSCAASGHSWPVARQSRSPQRAGTASLGVRRRDGRLTRQELATLAPRSRPNWVDYTAKPVVRGGSNRRPSAFQTPPRRRRTMLGEVR